MIIAGVIIAGGKSSRMGGREKAFMELGGQALLSHIITRLAPQLGPLAINANGDASRFESFGLPVISDLSTDVSTPLAGLEAALVWAKAQGAELVLTVPSDAPFVPADLAQRLAEAGAPSMASSLGQDHYLTALWPTHLGEPLGKAIRSGLRPVKAWAAQCGVKAVNWKVEGTDPFTNINTPEELAALAAQRN